MSCIALERLHEFQIGTFLANPHTYLQRNTLHSRSSQVTTRWSASVETIYPISRATKFAEEIRATQDLVLLTLPAPRRLQRHRHQEPKFRQRTARLRRPTGSGNAQRTLGHSQ